MPYYHAYISEVDEVYELDLTRKRLLKYIVEPYLKNEEFMCSGACIDPSEIEKIKISETKKSSRELIREARQKYISILGLPAFSDEEIIMKEGRDVTRQFITHLPRPIKKKPLKRAPRLTKKVFVVHGRDQKPMKELKVILQEFGLSPIVLHEQPSGSRTIVEKLEKYAGNIGYAFVILTPDDLGGSAYDEKKTKEDLRVHDLEKRILSYAIQRLNEARAEGKITEEERERLARWYQRRLEKMTAKTLDLSPRARQNVVLEFGYFTGKLGRDKVCCLHKGEVELPSDMLGIVYIPFKKSVRECRDKIIKELKAAGYESIMKDA